MSDVLGRLVDRALGSSGGLRPRIPARFEPTEAVAPSEVLAPRTAEPDGPIRHSPEPSPAAGPAAAGVTIAAPTPGDDTRPSAPLERAGARENRVSPDPAQGAEAGDARPAARPRQLDAAPRRPEAGGSPEPPGHRARARLADAPLDDVTAAPWRTDEDSPRTPRVAAIERVVAAASIDQPPATHDRSDAPALSTSSGAVRSADDPSDPASRVPEAPARRAEPRSREPDDVAGTPSVLVRPRAFDTAQPRFDAPDPGDAGRHRQPPIVRVSIGRIEVRAVHPPTPSERTPVASPTTAPSLEAYLRARNGSPR